MRTIAYGDYLDRVHGGWVGKCIGGALGARVENNRVLMHFTRADAFPPVVPPNDDLDLQILWLDALEERGLSLTSRDLAELWLERCWYPFNEYSYFRKNFSRAIAPPVSGRFNNRYFAESMGAPIRSEIWAFIAPGDSALASSYVMRDAVLDHDGDGIRGEQFLAALEAEAFFCGDLPTLVDHALADIPGDCRLAAAIRFVRERVSRERDWQATREALLAKHGHPDASNAVVNIAFIVMALFYGAGDFAQTQLIALNSGFDTDCTCATAGAILGIMGGLAAIPGDWRTLAGDTFVTAIDVRRPDATLLRLAEDTCRVGVELARVGTGTVAITNAPAAARALFVRSPAAVQMEVSYQDLPAIGFHESRTIIVSLANSTKEPLRGQVRIEGPADYTWDFPATDITLAAGETLALPCTVSHAGSAEVLASRNIFRAVFRSSRGNTCVRTFGLAGASLYRAFGPFWDTWDTDSSPVCPWLNGETISSPVGAANFNNWVSLRRAYLDETFPSLTGGVTINAYEDVIPLDEVFTLRGPCCVYLVQDLVSPVERTAYLVIGNNDSFALWLNGTLIDAVDECRFWMPFNHDYRVTLRAGVNRIVMKVLRRSRSFELSLGIKECGDRPSQNHHDWLVDLATRPPV